MGMILNSSKVLAVLFGMVLVPQVVFGAAAKQPNFDDIWLAQGFGAALNAVQSTVSAGDGLQAIATAAPKKKVKAKTGFVVASASPAKSAQPAAASNTKNQEALYAVLQRIVTTAMAYAPQNSVSASSLLFDQVVQVLVDVVRTPLLMPSQSSNLIKTFLPQLKTRPFSDQEIAVWMAIRPILGAYMQPDGTVVNWSPLQNVAVNALQSSLARLKGVQVHPVLAQRLAMAVRASALAIMQAQQQPLLTVLASLEQWQQLQSTVADCGFIPQQTKDLFQMTSNNMINGLSSIQAMVVMVTSQLAADATAPLSTRITNGMQYMNRCDGVFKLLANISADVYVDPAMQVLRNNFAQAMVDMVQKKTPAAEVALAALLQRAIDTGMLGVVQRHYVLTQILPQFDTPAAKTERAAAMKRMGVKK